MFRSIPFHTYPSKRLVLVRGQVSFTQKPILPQICYQALMHKLFNPDRQNWWKYKMKNFVQSWEMLALKYWHKSTSRSWRLRVYLSFTWNEDFGPQPLSIKTFKPCYIKKMWMSIKAINTVSHNILPSSRAAEELLASWSVLSILKSGTQSGASKIAKIKTIWLAL